MISDAVANSLETPVEELPPLSETVDLEALEALLSSTANDPSSAVTITFQYAGLHVHVHSGKLVYVEPAPGDREEPVDMA